MQEALKQNKIKTRSRLEEQRRQIKKEQRKETILTVFIGTTIIVMLFMILGNYNEKQMNKCQNVGHSTNYCEGMMK